MPSLISSSVPPVEAHSTRRTAPRRPHIVLVVARGEAVRNFIFSDTLQLLSQRAAVTLLTSVEHPAAAERARPYVQAILPLPSFPEHPLVTPLRHLIHMAHYRWLWTQTARYHWALRAAHARGPAARAKHTLLKAAARPLANRPALQQLTRLDGALSWLLRPTRHFDRLFRDLQPDLVFNCSHIHGPQADLPLRVAARLGLRTAAFIFSWDNLTTRSRIFVPYDHYLVWHQGMKQLLLEQYPAIAQERVHITGTPQFDFHFDPRYALPREELCRRIGLDPARPYILYTTGRDVDFRDEHRIVQTVIEFVRAYAAGPRPQLVVRTYIKGTSPDMLALARPNDPDIIFPPVLWDARSVMPLPEDLYIYSNLLRHTALGINAASTATLDLMMLGKPVINLGFEPPGAHLPAWARFSRHVECEHYRPVAQSGGVMVARSIDDLRDKLALSLAGRANGRAKQQTFLARTFGGTLDGQSGRRVADTLAALAGA